MVDEPYDLLPHHEIEELKRKVEELKVNQDRSTPQAVVNSIDQLTKAMNSMLNLFTQAAKEVKEDEKDNSEIMSKLDEVIEQNRTIAEGMVTISDTVKHFIKSQGHEPHPAPRPVRGPAPRPMAMPGPMPGPGSAPMAPPGPMPNFQQDLDSDFPELGPMPSTGKGPVPMPNMPFSDFELEKPKKKKGIFGRLRK